jgi:hypothetical protein
VTERELLIDCLRRLNGACLSYLLTGSMASNYWGIPRTTHDLDFVIQLPPSAVPKMMAAFSGDFFWMKWRCAPRISRRISSTPLTDARR